MALLGHFILRKTELSFKLGLFYLLENERAPAVLVSPGFQLKKQGF
jgi:hypothetical protein